MQKYKKDYKYKEELIGKITNVMKKDMGVK